MKIAEVWGSTQAEVELDDEHWLKGDDTYHTLSRRRARRGHQNLVCLMTDENRKSVWRDNVQYEFFPVDSVHAYNLQTVSPEMVPFLEAWQPDLVLLHSANRLQTLLCLQQQFPGTRYILDSNSAAITGIVLDQITCNPELVSGCIFKAQSIRHLFCKQTGYPLEHTRVFPSGIDVEQFKPLPIKANLDCIWVGYLRENNFRKKNVSILIELFANLDSQLHIVGSGKMMSKLRQLAPGNVTFLGFVDRSKLPKTLARYKLFLLPSLFDPCPRAVSEAMACGLPIVGLNGTLGTEDQILDSVNGYRVDSPNEMQNAIQSLLSDEHLRSQMGVASRQIAETQFNIDIIDGKLDAFFAEVIKRDSAQRC